MCDTVLLQSGSGSATSDSTASGSSDNELHPGAQVLSSIAMLPESNRATVQEYIDGIVKSACAWRAAAEGRRRKKRRKNLSSE